MKYSTIALSNRNFQSSVNLQFDINKKNKIDTYIPTVQSSAILKRCLNAVYNTGFNEDNATVLIGPYGRGKSHLLLVLSAIMSGANSAVSKECLNDLILRISKVDVETANLAKMVLERNKPMLPVIINSNHTDINQSFMLALREALERAELENFYPETYFDSALSMINLWENRFDSAAKEFVKKLKQHKFTLIKIKKGLRNCSREAYSLFCEIYPQITNGAEFNSMQNTDIVKIYSQVVAALCEQANYSGVYIIFDEFSKFLESAAAVNNMQNFKLIQDFAELAVRSTSGQVHLCCVTHKEILDYSQSDSFRTVDGRFKKVYFVASSEQSYELVANAIEHTSKFDVFSKKNKKNFDLINESVAFTEIFSELSPDFFYDNILIKCFPLHPITVYALIKISELVGQNERTLFTFLSQSGENTLSAFLDIERKNGDFSLVAIDTIYDYFSDLFRIEVFNPKIHSIWAKTSAALKQTEGILEHKVIKALAVMSIINEDKFKPVSNILRAAVNLSDFDYDYAIDQLIRNHIITLKRDRQYAFLTPNGVDIRKSIKETIEKGLVKYERKEILRSAYSVPYILPRQHNSEKCMMRFFRTSFMEANDFWDYTGDFSELMGYADGLILYLVSDECIDAQVLSSKLKQLELEENIIVCISEKWTDNDILTEYAAAFEIDRGIVAEEYHLREELDLYKYDLFKVIQGEVNNIYSPSNEKTKYYNCKRCLQDISNSMLISKELSRICTDFYSCTPVINNEMVNKNNLTPPIKKARAKAIDWILSHSEEIPAMNGYGPEVSVFRSTISVRGLDRKSTPDDTCLGEILKIIEEYVTRGETENISFSDIYKKLMAAPYGMRKGVIPVYISYVMRRHIDKILVYFKKKEVELTGDVFNNIDNAANEYSFCVEIGTKEKDDYIKTIIDMFGGNCLTLDASSRNTALKLMQSWFRGLPKFARVHNYVYSDSDQIQDVEPCVVELRKNLLLYDVNPYEFLFMTIPEIFGETDHYVLTEYIRKFANDANKFIFSVKEYIVRQIIPIFNSQIDGSLFSVMLDWNDSLSERTKKNVFDSDSNFLLKFISENSDFDDMYVVSQIAKNITTLAIEDWNDDMVNVFIEDIKSAVIAIDNFENDGEKNNQLASIALNIDGVIYEKNLADTEISPLAETAKNNIEEILSDYGDSISTQERISVLLKLLKKEIDQM